jgi:hypothetical protein
MSHGIYEHDKGYVKGDTWHKKEQYKTLDRGVFLDEALQVFDYEESIAIVPNRADLGDYTVPSTSNSIIRKDHNVVLNGSVGNRYTLLDMRDITKLAYGQICEAFTDDSVDVEIESVGTLDNGAIQFVSVIFDTFKVTGDDSETMNRLFITNDYQGGGVKQLISQVRVVCKNTRGVAIRQGKRNGSYTMTKHTSQVTDKVKGNMIDMATVQHRMAVEKNKLNILAQASPLSYEKQKQVLQYAFPVKMDSRGNIVEKGSRNANKHSQILEVYTEGQEGIDSRYQKSPYAFFNAVTNVLGQEVGRNGTSGDWDNITGVRANLKEKALDKILQLV